jgi:hypothetical protein
MVDQVAFPTQQGVQTRGAKLAALFCKFPQTRSDLVIVLWLRLVPQTATAQSDYCAGPSFTDLVGFD